jgi:LysM repeat protein
MDKRYILILVAMVLAPLLLSEFISKGHMSNTEMSESLPNQLYILENSNRENTFFSSHTVLENETLSSISQKYGIEAKTISLANGLTKDLVEPGMILRIPLIDGVLITVEEGDTVKTLSQQYSVEEDLIADFNWLEYPFTIYPGSILFIPTTSL